MAGSTHLLDPEAARTILAELKMTLPGLFACGLVDLTIGDFIDIDTAGSHPQDFLSYLAMTTRAFFQGDSVRTIQTVLNENAPQAAKSREIDEITIRSHNHLHVMARLREDPRIVLVAVTTLDIKFGLVMNAVRKTASEAKVPPPALELLEESTSLASGRLS